MIRLKVKVNFGQRPCFV